MGKCHGHRVLELSVVVKLCIHAMRSADGSQNPCSGRMLVMRNLRYCLGQSSNWLEFRHQVQALQDCTTAFCRLTSHTFWGWRPLLGIKKNRKVCKTPCHYTAVQSTVRGCFTWLQQQSVWLHRITCIINHWIFDTRLLNRDQVEN